MRLTVVRGLCALACALAFHALLVIGAVRFGWLAPDDTTLPELDLTSVDLSFSDSPDETAAPVATPPAPLVDEPPPPPPPPASTFPEPPSLDLPPNPHALVVPRPAEPRPTDVRPPLPEPPEPVPEPKPQTEQESEQETKPQDVPPPQPQPPAQAAPAAPAPSQARVAVDKPPAPRRRIKPEYPKGARQRGEEGDVTIELDVSSDGTVDGVRIVASCGFAELEQAAIQAVKLARFTPARRGSTNVPSTARLTLTFRLKE